LHTEPLDTSEMAFLNRQLAQGKKMFIAFYAKFIIILFSLSFVVSFYRAASGIDNAFSPLWYFRFTGALLLLSAGLCYIVFLLFHRKLSLDIKQGTKTIERCVIERKQYMRRVNKYYFYLNSRHCLSIEVNQHDFNTMNPGDELSIQYSTHCGIFFGYY
jgi:hypothetical protein